MSTVPGSDVLKGNPENSKTIYQAPDYAEWFPIWGKMRDCYKGEDVIKLKGQLYLRPTEGMELDGMGPSDLGFKRYTAYLGRAKYHDAVEMAVSTYVGLLQQKEALYQLPDALTPLIERATKNGESLADLHRRIHHTQLETGRIGLLFDIDTDDPQNPVPFIATYEAESIVNWDEGNAIRGRNKLEMVLLDESALERFDTFNWKLQYRYRALVLGDGAPTTDKQAPNTNYNVQIYEDQEVPATPNQSIEPVYRGKALDQIPFVFINTTHTLPSIEKPPLLALANSTLTLYKTEADYRQNLHMQGQDTLVVIGGRQPEGESTRTGSGAALYVEMGGDAKYIGVNGQGLAEQRQAIQNDVQDINAKAGQMLAQTKANAESGQALGTRLAAQTATLNSIAITAASALQQLLRIAAQWMGADPNTVVITPNLEFSDFSIPGQEIQALVVSKTSGLPISYESLHGVLKDKGLTTKTWDEEKLALQQDAALAQSWGILPTASTTNAGGSGTIPSAGSQ